MKTKLLLLSVLIPLLSLGQWAQVGQDIDGETSGDRFGRNVSISNDGSVLAAGGYYNDSNGSNSGQARVFKNVSGVWTQVGQDIIGELPGDYFGFSVALSGNGDIVAIGAPKNAVNGANTGHVRVYENLSGIWTQIGQDIDGEAASDFSGSNISINNDGTIIAIGAQNNDGTNGINSGHVRVYENLSGVWTQVGQDIDGENAGDNSGIALKLNNSGDIIAIGSRENDGINGIDSGHVRVYENLSGIWTQIGQDIDGENAGDNSGKAIGMNADGDVIAIGANSAQNGVNAGHVRVFKNLSGVWTQIGQDIDGDSAGDYFGSCELSNNGNILAIGGQSNDTNGVDSGHVRVYENISGVWTQIGADINGEDAGDKFGIHLSLSGDASTIAIGGWFNDGANGTDSGHVRVYNNTLLSVTENTFGSKFTVYPNPSFGLSKILLGENYSSVNLIIFNMFGKRIATQKHNNINEIKLNTQNLTTGIYIVKVQSGAKEATIKLVVK